MFTISKKNARPIGQIKGLWLVWRQSKTAQNISKVYLGDALSKIIGAGSGVILIRSLQKADYASYVAFISVGLLFSSLVGGGINNALVRFSAEHFSSTTKKPYELYVTSLCVEIFLFFILFSFILIFPTRIAALLLGNGRLAQMLSISMVYGLGTLLYDMGRSIQQAEENFSSYIWALLLKQIAILVFIVMLLLSGKLYLRAAVWGISICQLMIGTGTLLFGFKGFSKAFGDRKNWANKKILLDFLTASGWLVAYCAVLAAFSRMDILMLSRYASEAELANYGVAFQYYSLAILMLGSISAVLMPKFSKVGMQNIQTQNNFLYRWLKLSSILGIPVLIFVIWGRPIFVFINGAQYDQAFIVLAVLLIGVWLSLMFSPLVNILIGRKEFKFLCIIGIIAFCASIITNYIGVHILGAIGVAVALIITHNIVLQVPILWKVHKQHR